MMSRRSFGTGLVASLVGISSRVFAGQTMAIETSSGRVRGIAARGFQVFKGIPYGASTKGDNRFQPPLPIEWAGVRSCSTVGNACRQIDPTDPISLTDSWRGTAMQSEDCLNLNVWTPGCDDMKRAVMVWFHYGGLLHSDGARPFNDGARLVSKNDVVYVTVNHRVGIFGYLHLNASGLSQFANSANLGQQDLVLALQWVRDNISQFGGDPERVMIFGESGGGTKVSGLFAMPSASGLFHRAAMQSTFINRADTPETAGVVLDAVLEYFGWNRSQADRLLNVSAQHLLDAYNATVGVKYDALSPVADGTVMIGDPRDHLDNIADVPILLGHNRTENSISATDGDFSITWPEMPDRMAEFLGPSVTGTQALNNWRALKPHDKPHQVLFEMDTVAGKSFAFDSFASRMIDAGGRAYLYCLEWRTPVDGGKWVSPHMLDLPMVFDTVKASPSMIGTATRDAQKVSDAMSKAWAEFAKSGNPGWKPWGPTKKQTMMFNVESGPANNPFGTERAILGH